jgi:hypothetical protein
MFGSEYGEPCDETAVAEETPLPAGFEPVRATRCVSSFEIVPGDGEWQIRADQEATAGMDALARALRLPSGVAAPGMACPLIAYAPIVITVIDAAGRQLRPAIPHGGCSEPLPAVTDAIGGLTWSTLETTPVRRIRSELSVTSTCADDWKPVIAITALDGASPPRSALRITPRELRVCRFGIGDDPQQIFDMGNGVVVHGGKLSGTSTLDPAAATELLTAIADAPSAQPCAQLESPFAVIYPVTGEGPFVTVELGGCSRVLLDSDNSLRQLDATLVARLLG